MGGGVILVKGNIQDQRTSFSICQWLRTTTRKGIDTVALTANPVDGESALLNIQRLAELGHGLYLVAVVGNLLACSHFDHVDTITAKPSIYAAPHLLAIH